MQDFSKIGLHKVRQSPISDDNVKQTEDTKLKKKASSWKKSTVLKDGREKPVNTKLTVATE